MGMMGRRNHGYQSWMMGRVTPAVNTIVESGTEYIEQAEEDNPTTTVSVDDVAIEQQAIQANRPPRRSQA